MESITLELRPELASEIDSEATKLGYGGRDEYIRHLLKAHAHLRQELLADESQTSITDPETIQTISERIETISVELDRVIDRVDGIESTIQQLSVAAQDQTDNSSTDDIDSETAEKSETQFENEVSSFTELEAWLVDHGPRKDIACEIILEAATILQEDGPLSTGELQSRLFESYPDVYSSDTALWGSTVNRVYEEAPGFSKPDYGMYDFE